MRLNIFAVAAASLCLSAAHAQEMAPMFHNGSIMLITQDKNRVEIRYDTPRVGLSVTNGTVLFTGTRDAKGAYTGTACTFKKNCDPAPFAVTGKVTDRGVVLVGSAPRRDPKSCAVIGGVANSPSQLVFEYEPEPG